MVQISGIERILPQFETAPSRKFGLACILVFLLGSIIALSGTASAGAQDPIRENGTVRYNQSDGTFRVEYGYDIPDSVTRAEITFRGLSTSAVSLVSKRNVERIDNTTLQWNGGSNPNFVIRIDPGAPTFERTEFFTTPNESFAPSVSSRIDYRSESESPSEVEKSLTFAGDGYAGTQCIYFGEYELKEWKIDGVSVNVLVSDSVDEDVDVDAILNLYADGERLTEARRSYDSVNVFIIPEDENGFPRSGRVIKSDVLLDTSATEVTSIRNTPAHEYFHVVFGVFGQERMYWLKEASAQYYGSLLSLNTDKGTFEEFLEQVRTRRHSDAVLAKHGASTRGDADYQKGAHVLAALDARIRAETDGEKTLLDVLTTDEYNLSNYSQFRKAVVDTTGNESVSAWLDRYVRTSALPGVPAKRTYFVLGNRSVEEIRTATPTPTAESTTTVTSSGTTGTESSPASSARSETVEDGEPLVEHGDDLFGGESAAIAAVILSIAALLLLRD